MTYFSIKKILSFLGNTRIRRTCIKLWSNEEWQGDIPANTQTDRILKDQSIIIDYSLGKNAWHPKYISIISPFPNRFNKQLQAPFPKIYQVHKFIISIFEIPTTSIHHIREMFIQLLNNFVSQFETREELHCWIYRIPKLRETSSMPMSVTGIFSLKHKTLSIDTCPSWGSTSRRSTSIVPSSNPIGGPFSMTWLI